MSRKPVNHPNLITGELRVGHAAADYGVYSTGLIKKFELGTRYRLGDRVFHYGKAGAAINVAVGAKNTGGFINVTGGVVTKRVAGDMWIDLKLGATEGGATWFGTKNNMVGGLVVFHAAGANQHFRMITGHEKGANLATIKTYLDGPISSAIAATTMTEIAQNPYGQLSQAANEYNSVMGVPVVTHAINAYGWFQSWGPCWIVPSLPVADTKHWRTVVFVGDGSIKSVNDAAAEGGTSYSYQHAGFVIDQTSLAADNPPFIFLQICP